MGRDFEIELFKGKNEAVLHLRIPQAVNDELLLEAEERGVGVSDLVREAIRVSIAPKVLGRQVEKGFELTKGEALIDGLVDYYADLSKLLVESESALRKARAMEETVKRIRKLVESKFEAVYEREVKKLRLEQERSEKEHSYKRRQQQLAGVRGLDTNPTKLTEDDEKGLTELQKKQRRFLKD